MNLAVWISTGLLAATFVLAAVDKLTRCSRPPARE